MFFKTSEERKSAVVTTILFVIMILVMSIAIFPPEPKELEGGGGGGGTIALNFGFDDEGMGNNYTNTDRVSQTQANVSQSNENEILTSDNEDAVAIKETPKKDDKKTETKKPETKPVVKTPAQPQPDKSVTNAIGNLLGGDGNTGKAGNQGDSKGGLNNEGYDGSGGIGGGEGGGDGKGKGKGRGDGEGDGEGSGKGGGKGSGVGNYKLAGRKAVGFPNVSYQCNQEGTVVIDISVDRNGKVIEAKQGRGTTNSAQCLVSVAIKAARETKFEPSPNASEKQIGTITYNFRYTN